MSEATEPGVERIFRDLFAQRPHARASQARIFRPLSGLQTGTHEPGRDGDAPVTAFGLGWRWIFHEPDKNGRLTGRAKRPERGAQGDISALA